MSLIFMLLLTLVSSSSAASSLRRKGKITATAQRMLIGLMVVLTGILAALEWLHR